MDWKEASGDDTLLDLICEGREKAEQGSDSPGPGRWKKGIDVHESVCVDRSHSAGNPAKVDLVGGDIEIYETQPGKW